jgi:hypothetical protein
MEKIPLWTKVIIVNCSVLLWFLFMRNAYPVNVLAITGVFAFPIANLALFLAVRKK